MITLTTEQAQKIEKAASSAINTLEYLKGIGVHSDTINPTIRAEKKALAIIRSAREQGQAEQVPLSTNLDGLPANLAEQEYIQRETQRSKAEREYFDARPQIDTADRRNVFRAGFDAFAASSKPIAEHEPVAWQEVVSNVANNLGEMASQAHTQRFCDEINAEVDKLFALVAAPAQQAEQEPVACWGMDVNGEILSTISNRTHDFNGEGLYKVPLYRRPLPLAPQEKRPQNCGTGYCSCIECPYEPVKHEPVAESASYCVGNIHWIVPPLKDGTPLYTEPVDAKAIRAEALQEAEEIAKTIGGSFSVEFLAAIRGLK